MSSNDNEQDKSKTADAILEMLKEAGVSAKALEDEEHKFWDTQVRYYINRDNAVRFCFHWLCQSIVS